MWHYYFQRSKAKVLILKGYTASGKQKCWFTVKLEFKEEESFRIYKQHGDA
jgi:hypothetical protein